MAKGVEFKDYSIDVKNILNEVSIAWLHESAGEVQAAAKRTTRVDTGQLKNSWQYNVDESKMVATIGSPLENAIWEEFGTGEYALKGDGRKTSWKYKDRKGDWHTTKGKKPQRTFYNAFNGLKNKLIKAYENKVKGLNS